jgi:putative tricarboxylic transport membrane protein
VFGFYGAKLFSKITLIPTEYLWPAVFILACIGSYALDQAMLDIWIMVGAGLIGIVLQNFGFSAAPIIMGLILGKLVEGTLKQSLIIFDHSWLGFLERPIVLVFIPITLLSIFLPVIGELRARRARRLTAAEAG